MTPPVRIAQLSCGPEYAGIQHEIDSAAKEVGGEIFFPDIALKDVRRDFDMFGLEVRSPDLKLAIARAKALVDGRVDADAVFIATCFRCAEAAIVRNELRRYIHENSKLPVVSYSFTERTTAGTLLTRMEALTTIARRRALLAREEQQGITLGVDSGSSTTKAVVMKDNKIVGTGWTPTTEVLKSAHQVIDSALKEAGITMKEVEAIGTTGYGRFLIGKELNADLIQEELTVNSKGAVYLADRQHGPATVIDIGGMDNKAITVMDRSSIGIAVYVAFSGAVEQGIWSRVDLAAWSGLLAGCALLLLVGYGGSWLLGGVLGLPRAAGVAMLFAGTAKSVAMGAPLATVLFPPATAGIVLLPLLVYHLSQMVVAAPIAGRLRRAGE